MSKKVTKKKVEAIQARLAKAVDKEAEVLSKVQELETELFEALELFEHSVPPEDAEALETADKFLTKLNKQFVVLCEKAEKRRAEQEAFKEAAAALAAGG